MILAPIQTLVAEIGSVEPIGVQLATTESRGLLNRSGFVLFIVLFMVVGSWAACIDVDVRLARGVGGVYAYDNGGWAYVCTNGFTCDETYPQNPPRYYSDIQKTTERQYVSGTTSYSCSGEIRYRSSYDLISCNARKLCDNKCEADSINCLQSGAEWNTQNCECKQCTQNDTSFVISSCAYDPNRGQYINMQDHHRIKDCQDSSWQTQYYSSQCDTTQNDSNYQCIGTVNGRDVYMRAPWGATFSCKADGSCARAMQMIASGECEAPNRPTSSASSGGNSSDSQGESSDSQGESSDSQGESSDSQGESSDSQPESGTSAMVELPQRLYDSLGRIDYNIEFMQPFVTGIYDATWEMSGTLHDVNQNTRNTADNTAGILEKSTNIDNKLSTTNTLLTDIKNKNWSPNINVQAPNVNVENNTDVSGIQSRQDQTRDTLHNTNSLLEQIKGLLGSSGSDTIHVDTSKAPASIDSALKFWGNRNNRNFGTAGLDTNGWGNTNDSAKVATDSALSQGTWTTATGCDTTGGRKCDGAIIGQHGLDSAKNGMVNAYHGLGDTLRNGAFGDSLRQWGDKFTGGVITGSGSQNCPSVLSRSYRVTIIGETGYDFTFGTYLCSPIFGSVTAWALCRLLLRAGVALACMWFLFKCATGFKGQGEDD